MKVLFDHQTFSNQTYGGISRYIAELFKGINNSVSNQAYLSLLFSNNVYVKEMGMTSTPFFPKHNFYKKLSILYRLNQQYCKYVISKHKFDIFHATFYDPYFVPYLKGIPFVVTFHDMIHEKFSNEYQDFAENTWHTAQKKIVAERATRIIAVSQNTKDDLVELFNINPEKIQVIYHGNSLRPDSVPDLPLIDTPYLLYVGNRQRYKNFMGMLRAVAPLLKRYLLKVVCAGGGSFDINEQLYIKSLQLSDCVQQVPIDRDATLWNLYKSATAFVFPSRYEGFGIPVLESFACNCPCVLSNMSSLPEVAGKAALYFDPDEDESIRSAVEQVVTNQELRSKLIDDGRVRLAEFSWERTVEETLSVYEACIDK